MMQNTKEDPNIQEVAGFIYNLVDLLQTGQDRKKEIKKNLTLLFYWKQINPKKLIKEFFPDTNNSDVKSNLRLFFSYVLEGNQDKVFQFVT